MTIPPLVNFINMDHELVHLAQHIGWEEVENEFKGYFSENGCPIVPICKMLGLMLLKSLYNLSDENTVSRWIEKYYYQYFTGDFFFQTKLPIDPADFNMTCRASQSLNKRSKQADVTTCWGLL